MEPLSYKRMSFEEFCAATISVYQLEALEDWESIATKAFEHFEQEGNCTISVEELAQVHDFLSIIIPIHSYILQLLTSLVICCRS